MASSRCLKCGYPLTPGASCFCGTPTVQRRKLTAYKATATSTQPKRRKHNPFINEEPKVRITRLAEEDRKAANDSFRAARKALQAYQADKERAGLLYDAKRILRDLEDRYPHAIKRRDIFDALLEKVNEELRLLRAQRSRFPSRT